MIKTFPIRWDEETHNQVKRAARMEGKSMIEYILEAISEKMLKEQK